MELSRRSALAGVAFASLDAGCASHESPPRTPMAFRGAKRFVTLNDGLRMAYYEVGRGDPIVFLHGNPTSSYLWRNVVPHVSALGRCIAPDLFGMGDSDKLPAPGPGRYAFSEHARRLDELLARLGVRRNVTFVVHDWGGPLGFHWAARHPEAIRGVAFMETFVVSLTDQNTPRGALDFFLRFRTPEGEADVLERNGFVENVFLRQFPDMSDEDRMEYRRPFPDAASRWPTLEWPRQVPINGDPAETNAALQLGLDYMARESVTKLFVRADPGRLISLGRENVCRAWPSTSEVVVPGRHYIQEESPDEIGARLATWRTSVG